MPAQSVQFVGQGGEDVGVRREIQERTLDVRASDVLRRPPRVIEGGRRLDHSRAHDAVDRNVEAERQRRKELSRLVAGMVGCTRPPPSVLRLFAHALSLLQFLPGAPRVSDI